MEGIGGKKGKLGAQWENMGHMEEIWDTKGEIGDTRGR